MVGSLKSSKKSVKNLKMELYGPASIKNNLHTEDSL